VALLVLGAAATGCSTDPAVPLPAPVASSPTTPSAPLPADGVALRAFGFSHGPLDTLSLPRTSVLRTAVDQADNVTLVLAAPAAGEVTAYLLRTLPATGFQVTAENRPADTLAFAGYGWSGSVTGTPTTTAVLLRPL